MAIASAHYWLAPLTGEFQNAVVLLALPHPVYFQSMNRPAVPSEEVCKRNRFRSRSPGDKRVIQNDKAAAGGERFKQFVVASAAGGRLNSSVRFVDFTLGQAAETQVKQVSLVPQ